MVPYFSVNHAPGSADSTPAQSLYQMVSITQNGVVRKVMVPMAPDRATLSALGEVTSIVGRDRSDGTTLPQAPAQV